MNVETITILPVETVDDWGQKTRGPGRPESGWTFAPNSSTEENEQRNTVLVELVGYGPAGTSLSAHDVIERADGKRWEVVGEVGEWASPFSAWRPGVEARFRRVSG